MNNTEQYFVKTSVWVPDMNSATSFLETLEIPGSPCISSALGLVLLRLCPFSSYPSPVSPPPFSHLSPVSLPSLFPPKPRNSAPFNSAWALWPCTFVLPRPSPHSQTHASSWGLLARLQSSTTPDQLWEHGAPLWLWHHLLLIATPTTANSIFIFNLFERRCFCWMVLYLESPCPRLSHHNVSV